MSDAVVVEVWDKTRTRQRWIGDPIRVTATPRHNQQPAGEVVLPIDHKRADDLLADGARVVVRYRGEHLLSGTWSSYRTEGSRHDRHTIVQIRDDWWLLDRLLAWQVPTAPITGQSAAEYHVVTGPAETVVKTLATAAVARTGEDVTIAPDLGRGDTITVRARMDHPTDLLLPLLDQAGIGVTVRQTGTDLVLDVYEPTTWPGILSEAGGTLTDLSWSRTAPTVTRVVLMADGEGTARAYRELIDTAREAQWGYAAEDPIDARDLKSTDPGFEAAALARMTEALAAGAPTTGLSVSLAEAGRFQYGGTRGVHVGDVVTVELAPGVRVTDVLRAATLTWDRTGVRVTPVIGERRDDPNTTLARTLAGVARKMRALQTRR